MLLFPLPRARNALMAAHQIERLTQPSTARRREHDATSSQNKQGLFKRRQNEPHAGHL